MSLWKWSGRSTVTCETGSRSSGNSPIQAAQPPGTLEQISLQLKLVDQAVRDAEPGLLASQGWKDELAAYAETLTLVRARLGNFEIMLQIRRAQSANARTRIGAIHSWADLAKHIG